MLHISINWKTEKYKQLILLVNVLITLIIVLL